MISDGQIDIYMSRRWLFSVGKGGVVMDIKQILNNENALLKLLFEKNSSIIVLQQEVERLTEILEKVPAEEPPCQTT